MKTRNLVILAVVVAAMAAYIYFVERHQPTSEEARERADKVLPDLDRAAITAIELSNEHGQARLEKQGETWRLVAPFAAAADDAAVAGLIGAVADLKAERRLAAGEVEPAEYGLDRPEMTVTLAAGAERSWTLRVGGSTALGGNRAVATDAPGVVICSSYFAVQLAKEPSSWRSKNVVAAVEMDLASLAVETPFGRVEAARVNDAWQLLAPLADAADRTHLRQTLADLNALRVEEFVDEAAAADLGLAAPRATVTLVRADGSAPTVLELGGGRRGDDQPWVACRRDGGEVFWVRDSILTPLEKAPVLWRSPTVFAFDSWDVEGVTVRRGDTSVGAKRADGVWSQDDGSVADFTTVDDFLRALAELPARAFDLTSPTTPELGRVELAFEAKGESPAPAPVTLTFYAPMGEGGRAMATVSAPATVMSVDVPDLDPILLGPGALAPATPEPAAAAAGDSAATKPE